jgi:hypothetical protein
MLNLLRKAIAGRGRKINILQNWERGKELNRRVLNKEQEMMK